MGIRSYTDASEENAVLYISFYLASVGYQRIDRMRNGTMVKRPWNVYLYTQEFFGLSDQEMMQYFGAEQSSAE